MAVEVGLHQASPPPSYSFAYCPEWISCEYVGTASTIVDFIVVALGRYGLVFTGSEATAPMRVTLGETFEPAAR